MFSFTETCNEHQCANGGTCVENNGVPKLFHNYLFLFACVNVTLDSIVFWVTDTAWLIFPSIEQYFSPHENCWTSQYTCKNVPILQHLLRILSSRIIRKNLSKCDFWDGIIYYFGVQVIFSPVSNVKYRVNFLWIALPQ